MNSVEETNASHRRIVKSSVQSLRQQCAKARTVLMTASQRHLVLTNSKNLVVNRFEPRRIVFVQTCPGNAHFFGVLISHSAEDTSATCRSISQFFRNFHKVIFRIISVRVKG